MSYLLESPLFPLLFLLGALLLTACNTSMLRLGKFKSKEIFRSRPLLQHLFPRQDWESLYFSISISKHIYQLSYAIFSFFYLLSKIPSLHAALLDAPTSHNWIPLVAAGGSIITVSLILDYATRLITNLWSKQTLQVVIFGALLYLLIFSPILFPLLYLTRGLLKKFRFEDEPAQLLTDKSKLREMIRESELEKHLNPADQKLIGSFLNFKERIAKEIMVPRVDLFALEAETPIRDAAPLFAKEGYSPGPAYP